ISKIKTNLNLNLSAGFTRTPGLINGRANNANSQNYGLGVVLGSNISQNVDFTVSNNISYNNVQNTLQTDLNQNYYTNATSVRLNVIFKGFVFNTDFTNTINRGLSSASFNQNIGLWNMGVGRQLFKNKQGEIRFTVYDLLKQNQAITRNVTETYTEDVRSNLLQRYFMVTFSYRFRKISSNAGDMAPQDFKGPIPGMMPGMMPGMPMPGGGPPR
ncbi:MAG: outer membrane beta-barrel protein, partial [Flexibacteraceae bacterium]